MCKRPCDQYHKDQDPEKRFHKCESGHNSLSLAGKCDHRTGRPITIDCFSLKDDDLVTNNEGKQVKWSEFKKQ